MKSLRPLLDVLRPITAWPQDRDSHGPRAGDDGWVEGTVRPDFYRCRQTELRNYYHRGMELVSPRGVILIDNVLWDGEVLRDPPPDDRTAAIQELNRVVTPRCFT